MKKPHAILLGIVLLSTGFLSFSMAAPRNQNAPPPAQGDKQPPEKEPDENANKVKKKELQGEAGKNESKEENKDAKKDEKWDVDNPPGPRTEAPIDVTQGTWLSLDVSPDGKEIVFDLLGDLYTIPFAGGEAKALTHDIAWQMQPRYSPDGRQIA